MPGCTTWLLVMVCNWLMMLVTNQGLLHCNEKSAFWIYPLDCFVASSTNSFEISLVFNGKDWGVEVRVEIKTKNKLLSTV